MKYLKLTTLFIAIGMATVTAMFWFDFDLKSTEEKVVFSDSDYDIEFFVNNNKDAKEIKEKIEVKEYDKNNIENFVSAKTALNKDSILTDIVYVDTKDIKFSDARVVLHKQGEKKANALLKCESSDFDSELGQCSNWQIVSTEFEDSDNKISFNTTHFSAYVGAYLEIINEQSNLTQGDVWEVRFQTYGQSDLIIEAVDGTVYPADIELIGIFCGEYKLTESEYIFEGQVITVPNYTCDDDLSYVRNTAVSPGRHWLSLSFGYTVDMLAHNFACNSGTLNTICYVTSSQAVADNDTISGTGTMVIQSGGALTTAYNATTHDYDIFNLNIDTGLLIQSGGTITGNVIASTASSTIIGSINVNGKGNAGGASYSTGYGSGGGAGTGAQFSGGGGAGHGGDGGNGTNGIAGGGSYGSITSPTSLGSGGGSSWNSLAGAGGGSVKLIIAGTFSLSGSITANGANGGTEQESFGAGAGAGGSIWINADTITGNGSITTNGGDDGNSTYDGGGGGGGRIAIYRTTDTSSLTYTAYGGEGNSASDGGAGTIYKKMSSSSYGDLYLNNNGKSDETTTQPSSSSYTFYDVTMVSGAKYVIPSSTTLTITNSLVGGSTTNSLTINSSGTLSLPNATTTFSTITINNSGSINNVQNLILSGAVFYHNGSFPSGLQNLTISTSSTFEIQNTNSSTALSLSNVIVQNSSSLRHQDNSATETDILNFSVSGNMTIDNTSSINVNYRGLDGGAAYTAGYGSGGGAATGASFSGGGGAGYGGGGGDGSNGIVGGNTYGSYTAPTSLGSGGGASWNSLGGAGGGAIKLTIAGTFTLNGSITANGSNGQSGQTPYGGGAGSGGSVWINAEILSGSGSITANGGAGYNDTYDGGGGGGGRIALYANSYSPSITYSVSGGTGNSAEAGSAGTIYSPPPTVSNAAVSNIGETSATANGSIASLSATVSISDHGHVRSTSQNPALPDPLAYWKLNDNAASTAVTDAMAHFNGTAVRNTSLFSTTTAIINRALNFNGTSDYININSVASAIGDGPRSVFCWIKSDGGVNDEIVAFNSSTGGNVVLWRIMTGGYMYIHNGINWLGTSSIPVNDGLWHHVGYTYNNNTHNFIIYLDGEEDSNVTFTPAYAPDNRISIGQEWDTDTPSDFYGGLIDDVRIYDHVLNESEISSIYNSGAGTETYNFNLSTYSQRGATSSLGTFSTSMTGLDACSTYYVNSYAKLSNYLVVYGNEVSFDTPCPPTEFISIIDPDNGVGTDYTSLSAWEAAVQADLTAANTYVFDYNPDTASGTLPDGFEVEGETSGATGTLVHITGTTSPASGQIMIKNASAKFSNGEKIYLTASSSYYVYASSPGKPVIGVAECRSTGGSADTNAVTIDGWTTSSSTYIKIWTDPTDPYGRHRGKWDEWKYRLETSSANSSMYVYESYTQIDGLQVKNNNSSLYAGLSINTSEGSVYISNNIVREGNSSPTNKYGIRFYSSGGYVYNNIIYDFIGATSFGMQIVGASYLYNNTIYNCNIGLYSAAVTNVAKNNIAQNNTTGYTGTFHASSSNNISSDGTTPGTSSYASTTVQFLDSANDDFHLAPGDTAAKNAGTSTTSVETRHASSLQYDIDGTSRGSAWDIGADEVPVEFVSTICQATSTGGDCNEMDYATLSNWEDKVETDLSASTTRVFSGTNTGSLSENNLVYLRMSLNGTSTASGYVVATTSDQILIDGIVGSSTTPVIATSGYVWQYNASNYFTVSGTGDALGASPIAIAKIDGAWSASDTTAVAIDGWTTDNDNYIKVYTTPTARHSGKWDYGKYRITSNCSGYEGVIYLVNSYVKIDGLQINLQNLGEYNNSTAITSSGLSQKGQTYISNNIIKADIYSGTNPGIGIRAINSVNEYKMFIWNNVIYNFANNVNSRAIMSVHSMYAYNNTIFNSNIGINNDNDNPNPIVAKNNLISSTTNPFSGTFAAGTDYNATDINDTPGTGTHNATSVIFSFVSSSTNDFHLNPGSRGVDEGFNVLASTTLFNTDVDGGVRPSLTSGLNWDIGADETATKIYRSVGNIATAISNAATVSITGWTATFSAVQPDNIGVGDVVQYGTGVYNLAFITGRSSSTVYSVQSYDGTQPSATTTAAMNIYRAHLTLNDWETQTVANVNTGISDTVDDLVLVGQDLMASNTIMMVAAYASAAGDTEAVTISGWTTGENNYIKIYTPVNTNEVGVTQRHVGKWDNNKYYISHTTASSYDTTISIGSDSYYVNIDGLQLYVMYSHDITRCIYISNLSSTNNKIKISNNIIRGYSNTNNVLGTGIQTALSSNNNIVKVWNNIVYGFKDANNSDGIGISIAGTAHSYNMAFYNNTVYGNRSGFYDGMYHAGILKNNISYNNTIANYNGGADEKSDNNLSGPTLSDAPGTNPKNAITLNFIDEANNDFHLAPGSSGIDQGLNLSTSTYIAFTDDIDGNHRRTWDIGADEASVEFVSTVMQTGGAFSSLSAWETANQVDLTATTTAVFSCSTATGTIPVGSNVVGDTSGATASSTVMSTSTNQILLYNINGTFVSGGKAYIQGASSSTNYCILSNAGNPAIAVAKIDGAWTVDDNNEVIIDGWSTSKYNNIKIYTTETARHSGKWEDTKYRLTDSGSSYNFRTAEDYTKIIGLQISVDSGEGINITSPVEGLLIDKLLIVGLTDYCRSGIIFTSGANNTTADILNTIIYGNWGYEWYSPFINYYANNSYFNIFNSVFTGSNNDGIRNSGGEYGLMKIKNSVVFGNNGADDISAQFSNTLSIDNCATDDGLGTNAVAPIDWTSVFEDYVNGDFHLKTEDTQLKDSGVSISSEFLVGIQNDINYDFEGQARFDGFVDIGADEAPTILYRSVGNTSASLSTGGATVTISSSTATFSVAQPDNVGVGDVLQIGTSTYQLAFITGRTSASVFSVQSATGSLPIATTSAPVSVYRAHEFLDDWEDQVVGDVNDGISDSVDDNVLIANMNLVASNTAMFVPCYASTSADNLSVDIDGWITSTSSYISIYTPVNTDEVGISQKHNGSAGTGYRISVGNDELLNIYDAYVRVSGLEFDGVDHSNNQHIIQVYGDSVSGNIYLSNNIIHTVGDNFEAGIRVRDVNIYTVNILNNLIYDIDGFGINSSNANATVNVYNNTIYDVTSGGGIYVTAGNVIVANNAVFNNNDDFFGTMTFDHNASDDLDGTNAIDISPARFATEQAGWQAAFRDYVGYDFRVKDFASVLYDSGTTIITVTDDILGTARPQGLGYDVGAFEFVQAEAPEYIIEGEYVEFEGSVEFR